MKNQSDKKNKAGGSPASGDIPTWSFLSQNDGSFLMPYAEYISGLYFPLMNNYGMKCSITPELKGDIASSFQHYLTAATVTEELHRNVSGRNFWIKVEGHEPWSVTGNSSFQKSAKWTGKADKSEVEGHIGAFIVRRNNSVSGLACETTVFVPQTNDFVELMKVRIKNVSDKAVQFTPTSATPIFGRHADNFRDHRQVTTMFQKIYNEEHGVRVKPTIVHDEKGHSVNKMNYVVLGFGSKGERPVAIWPLMRDFIGQGGSLDNPKAVYENLPAPVYAQGEADGREAIGAMRYRDKTLKPGESAEYIIIHGISEEENDVRLWKEKFGSAALFNHNLKHTLAWWQEFSSAITIESGNSSFDNWVKWVSYQLKCRQIFGNSYLPDFGYGRGGRGWRDLWQDLLAIFLVDPESAREEIINSMKGVRVDGSNATIIGTEPGTFIADRNNVARSWCDHGAWPAFVINFYIEQTGDFDILFHKIPYWKDQFIYRSKKQDVEYDSTQGPWQKDHKGKVYEASILEHLLIQQLSAFYHVGDHNILLLEGADWNDTYDMAREKGESTGFYAFYAQNLRLLAQWLSKLYDNGLTHISVNRDMAELIETNGRHQKNQFSPAEKQKRLQKYFHKVSHSIDAKQTEIGIQTLILDLILKADHINEVIREQEWIQMGEDKGFYNGHYNNVGLPVDGPRGDRVMMDLTTQVMAIMHDQATKNQVRSSIKAARRYLKDGKGYRLCTPFPEIDMTVGRISGFVYGNKEHGSKWMQQNIMLAYGLYHQGFIEDAEEIIGEVYSLSTDTATAQIFPGLPSYFGPEDKAAYAYLTGSSTWLILTLTTQMFGVKGSWGDLCLQPKLTPAQFNAHGEAHIECNFYGQRIRVTYTFGDAGIVYPYLLKSIDINGKNPILPEHDHDTYIIEKSELEKLCNKKINKITILLGGKI